MLFTVYLHPWVVVSRAAMGRRNPLCPRPDATLFPWNDGKRAASLLTEGGTTWVQYRRNCARSSRGIYGRAGHGNSPVAAAGRNAPKPSASLPSSGLHGNGECARLMKYVCRKWLNSLASPWNGCAAITALSQPNNRRKRLRRRIRLPLPAPAASRVWIFRRLRPGNPRRPAAPPASFGSHVTSSCPSKHMGCGLTSSLWNIWLALSGISDNCLTEFGDTSEWR